MQKQNRCRFNWIHEIAKIIMSCIIKWDKQFHVDIDWSKNSKKFKIIWKVPSNQILQKKLARITFADFIYIKKTWQLWVHRTRRTELNGLIWCTNSSVFIDFPFLVWLVMQFTLHLTWNQVHSYIVYYKC